MACVDLRFLDCVAAARVAVTQARETIDFSTGEYPGPSAFFRSAELAERLTAVYRGATDDYSELSSVDW